MKTFKAERAGLIAQAASPGHRGFRASGAACVASRADLKVRPDPPGRRAGPWTLAGPPSVGVYPPTTERGPCAMLCQPRSLVKHRPRRLSPKRPPPAGPHARPGVAVKTAPPLATNEHFHLCPRPDIPTRTVDRARAARRRSRFYEDVDNGLARGRFWPPRA